MAGKKDKSPLFVDRSSSGTTTVILILMIALLVVGAYVLVDNLLYGDAQTTARVEASNN